LDADPEILQARKKEVSLEECARQREAYRALAEKLPNGHVIDASQPLEDVVRDVQSIVLNYMAERTAKRMKRVSHEKNQRARKEDC
jgi:thymidylate kinase